MKNNLHSIKHNKEFCLSGERVTLCLLSTIKGCSGRAHDKIRMKSTGTSETMCYEKMMHAGADMGEWIEWLATLPFGDHPHPPKNRGPKTYSHTLGGYLIVFSG